MTDPQEQLSRADKWLIAFMVVMWLGALFGGAWALAWFLSW